MECGLRVEDGGWICEGISVRELGVVSTVHYY